MAKRYAYTLPKHKIEYGVLIPVADLHVDPTVQRNLNSSRAKQIGDSWVEGAEGEITVSRRKNGLNYVGDGYHRVAAATLRGITHLHCEVHHGLSLKDEATLFMIKNRESAKPVPIDQYKVALVAGVDQFVDTDKVITAHGLSMGSTSSNGIGAVQGVVRIVEDYGPDILERVVTVAEAAWGRTPATWDGMVLGGLGKFIGSHPAEVKDAELAKKLTRFGTADALVGKIHHLSTAGASRASGTTGRVSAAYMIIKDIWNNRRKPANRIA